MSFGLETHQMIQDFLKRFDELRRVAFCHQGLLDVGKEAVVAKIVLEVTILFPVDAQYFGNIQSDSGKWRLKLKKASFSSVLSLKVPIRLPFWVKIL